MLRNQYFSRALTRFLNSTIITQNLLQNAYFQEKSVPAAGSGIFGWFRWLEVGVFFGALQTLKVFLRF